MSVISNALRKSLFVGMILLAVMGVGLTGAAPSFNRERDALTENGCKIELFEKKITDEISVLPSSDFSKN